MFALKILDSLSINYLKKAAKIKKQVAEIYE